MPRHQVLAEVWTILQGRHDISNIVREILGQHAVDTALQDDSADDTDNSIRIVLWIKTIFDLQRAYLSGCNSGISECPPYLLPCLLPPELLFSTILYLIQLKSKLFSSQTTLITRDMARQRLIIAECLLSGLRLMLLRKKHIAASHKRRLQTAINAAWQHDRLQGVEQFVVCDLFAGVLDALTESRIPHSYETERLAANIPSFAEGLYPLDFKSEAFIPSLLYSIIDQEPDWIDAYWVIFDVLWAIECALTQRLVDLGRKGYAHGDWDESGTIHDETLASLRRCRAELVSAVFDPNTPMDTPPELLESLTLTLLEWTGAKVNLLSSQDSLAPASLKITRTKSSNYGRHFMETSVTVEDSLHSFVQWLAQRSSGVEQFSLRSGLLLSDLQNCTKEWVNRTSSANPETRGKDLDGTLLPIYLVNCPKLHPVPRKLLEYELRWTDKWAFESLQENSPFINWKEGIACPSCSAGEKIQSARLLEPLQNLSPSTGIAVSDEHSLGQYSTMDSNSQSATSLSETVSHNTSSPSNQRTQLAQPPLYIESPISPAAPYSKSSYFSMNSPISPCNDVGPFEESLNVPIAISRQSVDLPIPVDIQAEARRLRRESKGYSSKESYISSASTSFTELPISPLNTIPSNSSTSEPIPGKTKTSRTTRIANSIRRKPTPTKASFALPQSPLFAFSATGHSLLLWRKGNEYVARFDIPSDDNGVVQCCRYDIPGVEFAAAGNHRCAVFTNTGNQRKLVIYNGIKPKPESELAVEISTLNTQTCIAVSRNDKYVATSINDEINIYRLEDGIQPIAFHHQIHVHELRDGQVHRRTIPVNRSKNQDDNDAGAEQSKTDTGWFGASTTLSMKEAAEEAQRQSKVIARLLYFSPDSERLVVATHLNDHHVYVDVWDCTREPVSTISENSRSFKLPPWTLNDGDLTTIFYSPHQKSVILTAFLGKEYPLHIPYPSYSSLQNEEFGTKVVHAAQSPSGNTFIIANGMTEILQFEYTPKGTLNHTKLKKAAKGIGTAAFRPECVKLAMPREDLLIAFWIKEGRMMLRRIGLGSAGAGGESFRDYDLRPHFDRLMGLKGAAVIARAPTLRIPELGEG